MKVNKTVMDVSTGAIRMVVEYTSSVSPEDLSIDNLKFTIGVSEVSVSQQEGGYVNDWMVLDTTPHWVSGDVSDLDTILGRQFQDEEDWVLDYLALVLKQTTTVVSAYQVVPDHL